MTHIMRQKVSLGDRRNRIKEISIKQSCWTDNSEPDTMSKPTLRSTPAPHEAVRQSLSAGSAGGSSYATSNSSQSANSTPVVLDDYDEDEDV